ncbi:MAG TPA: hypothetical protein VM076_15195 [Gemmatimonadaceae bacterium]|nr:hypothetical protein [Gemmatimonadaceae bacterium]
MSSNVPDKPATGRSLDRAALERVLARATELQAGTSEPGESMTEEQLIDLGKEVGLSSEHVRQAIAEEQTRVALREPEGQVSGVFGPSSAWAQRVIVGKQADVLARIDRYMESEESLTVRRRFADRVTWEARRDLVGNIKRGIGLGGRRYALARADETGATVVPVDATRVLVRLDATFADARRRNVIVGGSLAGAGVVSGGSIVAIAATFPGSSMVIAGAIAAAAAGFGGIGLAAMARTQRVQVTRAQLALEQALDRLEHGDAPTKRDSLFDVLASVINR